jgi:hypothetical protein
LAPTAGLEVLGKEENIFSPAGICTLELSARSVVVVHTTLSRYTDYATPLHRLRVSVIQTTLLRYTDYATPVIAHTLLHRHTRVLGLHYPRMFLYLHLCRSAKEKLPLSRTSTTLTSIPET